MKKFFILLVVIAGIRWYMQPPSVQAIIDKTKIEYESDTLEYDGVSYEVEWSEEVSEYAGDIRFIHRSYHEGLPPITHEAVVTTDEFSDPGLVSITPIKNGSMSWRAPQKPEGTLVVLHFIPENKRVLEKLQEIEEGDFVTFRGYKEVDRRITGSDGSLVGLGHDNHEFLLLEALE